MQHHPHDKKWIDQLLRKLPPDARTRVRAAYSARYVEILEQRSNDHTAESVARTECNTRLRLYIAANLERLV